MRDIRERESLEGESRLSPGRPRIESPAWTTETRLERAPLYMQLEERRPMYARMYARIHIIRAHIRDAVDI